MSESTAPEIAVIGLGLFTPNYPSVDAWRAGTAADPEASPSGAGIERRSRRLSSALMKAFSDVYLEAAVGTAIDLATVGSVFGSSLGEANTMIGLLDQMWALKEEPSPMAFAASVHNAAAGVVSISHKNQSFTTSIAADFDTVAMSLLEAVGLLAQGYGQVLVACGDEPAPEKLVEDDFHWAFLSAAIALSSEAGTSAAIARLRLPRMDVEATVPAPPLSVREHANPQVGLWYLIDAIVHERWGHVALDNGRGRGWTVEVLPP